MKKYIFSLIFLLLVGVIWLASSLSLIVVENKTGAMVEGVKISQLGIPIWSGQIKEDDSVLIYLLEHKMYGVDLTFFFGGEQKEFNMIGYMVPGDVFDGYHVIKIKSHGSLEYGFEFYWN
ncbi:hypothetical protein [Microbulbifer spongiae]|uniref:Uncharacterized protein n=1 Tax=Microbulbifer spongiae TaxID=2944933 RepID=A0ABY9EC88_9GAMM|nr:hypothetical protein [Microbulbifer sp. MI-G]WKD50595.1 hypothetical protein M8T91_03985 [Microbulbifer sp. MI-G]